ncbi:MAG: hypothetical protein M3680_11995 [Myxococcota bacterium]|nr:hypothetical protein [Myxococcota bacterium]
MSDPTVRASEQESESEAIGSPFPSTEDESDDYPCSLCNARVPREHLRYVNAQPACRGCTHQLLAELAEQRPAAKHYPLAFAGGLAGAIVGAAVWAGIAVVTDFEVGYVAILVGFLAGLGVRIAARTKRSLGMQLMASALAIVGLLVAKYMILAHVIVDLAKGEGVAVSYFDPRIFDVFPMALKEMLSPFDALWLILAVGAAYRVPQPSQIDVQE